MNVSGITRFTLDDEDDVAKLDMRRLSFCGNILGIGRGSSGTEIVQVERTHERRRYQRPTCCVTRYQRLTCCVMPWLLLRRKHLSSSASGFIERWLLSGVEEQAWLRSLWRAGVLTLWVHILMSSRGAWRWRAAALRRSRGSMVAS